MAQKIKPISDSREGSTSFAVRMNRDFRGGFVTLPHPDSIAGDLRIKSVQHSELWSSFKPQAAPNREGAAKLFVFDMETPLRVRKQGGEIIDVKAFFDAETGAVLTASINYVPSEKTVTYVYGSRDRLRGVSFALRGVGTFTAFNAFTCDGSQTDE